MEANLLVCIRVQREKFQFEEYIGDDDVFALVESGSFSFDENGDVHTVGPFEAVNFKKGKLYSRKIIDKVSMYLFRYRSEFEIFNQNKITFKDTDRIKSTLKLLQLSDAGLYGDDFQYKKALFSDIVTQHKLENMGAEKVISQKDAVVRDAIGEINQNIHKKISLTKIAKKHFLSYVQFSRRFKTTMGITPQEYIVDMRMKKAKQMLGESDLLIKEIAVECGFTNEYYFSNFFKQYSGFSPSEFRKMVFGTNN